MAYSPSVTATPTTGLDDADLGSLDFWGRPAEERDRYFDLLRREAPISRHEPPEDILGLGDQGRLHYWAIVRYDDIRDISRNPETFCSSEGVQFGDAPPEMLEASQSFLAMDAPRHTKLRKLVSSAFTPRQVARIEDSIAASAKRIVAEVAPTGGGEFVELIGKRLPLQTISDLLGVPAADRERVMQAADTLIGASDPDVFRRPFAAGGPRDRPVDVDRVRQRTGHSSRTAPRRRSDDRPWSKPRSTVTG